MSVVKPLTVEPSEKAIVKNSQLKFATYNLFNYLEPPNAFYDFERIYSVEQWRKKQQWICDYLDEHQPDVIGFQEVFSPESLKNLVNKKGYQYFSVVDKPQIIDDFIFKSPVVAIASKYPIIEVSSPEPDSKLILAIGLKADFSFSRKVLRATIDLPHIGHCDCYVVHFKSKRSMIETGNDKEKSIEQNITEQLQSQVSGRWASSIQRGSEAALLMTSMIDRKAQTSFPMVLMGDFNNTLLDGVLEHLLTDSLGYSLHKDIEQYLIKYSLRDSWDLHLNLADESSLTTDSSVTRSINISATNDCYLRKPTHYYGGKGSVLDYILLSCEFDASYQKSIFELSSYHVYERHLINPIFDRDGESTDHGIVLITLSLRC